MRTLFATASIAAVVLLSGCTGAEEAQPADPVVGRWEVPDGDAGVEFFSDGSVLIREGVQTEEARWRRLEDGGIFIETTNLTGNDATPQVFQIELLDGGDEALLTVGNRAPVRIRRVDPR